MSERERDLAQEDANEIISRVKNRETWQSRPHCVQREWEERRKRDMKEGMMGRMAERGRKQNESEEC